MYHPALMRSLTSSDRQSATILPLRLSDTMTGIDLRDALVALERKRGAATIIRRNTDNSVRWTPGERLHHLIEAACESFAERDAIVLDSETLSFRELDRRANQLAQYLIERGLGAGDRIGLLFDKSAETYVALFAVMKINAAYVPLDPSFPVERVRFILGDANIKAIVSMSEFAERLESFGVAHVMVDAARADIESCPTHKPVVAAPADDAVAYIIYTSGTTGNPKGVAIEHPGICNFVRVASELYGYQPGDRVYQGMTIAFDFSVEETWVPLMAGATLVPGKAGGNLFGDELADFLISRGVTAMCCCPTLLATIKQDIPALRILIVGGEACPQNLVARWSRAGRVILNTYGPTEATVTATMTELVPGKPVTIGLPLPTYSIVILDPAADKAMPAGELGEVGIAGIGLAKGYVNRDDLTAKKFIADFLNIPDNPSGRIYRTGDLGRLNENGEIEYRGRIDTQVKIRGYRIELSEIESVLLGMPEIAQAAVATFEPEADVIELVAYYALKPGAAAPDQGEMVKTLRSRLPAYMVPAYFELLPAIPMTLSNKADHKKLPKPTGARVLATSNIVEAKTEIERELVLALTETLNLKSASVEHNFFDDLGANSLLMARFCARIRQNPRLSNISMRDIYTNPTIAKLARHFETAIEGFVAGGPEAFHTPSRLSYYGTGALQLAFFAAYGLFGLWLFDVGAEWTYAAIDNPVAMYLRAVAASAGVFVALTALPVAAKWALIGRWKEEKFPLWSLRYFRFWMIKMLTRSSPMIAFSGTPLYNVYLRMLGAKIGRGAVIQCRFVPVCTDLISIGANTILRKESIVLGYRAQSNFIHTGPIAIGDNSFVGEASVLDIDTVMGDHTQLGHTSSLQSGQRVPDGRRYHGSPAVETTSNYCKVENGGVATWRAALYSALELVGVLLIAAPLPLVAINYIEQYSAALPATNSVLGMSVGMLLLTSAGSFFGSILAALAAIYAVPRLCQRFLTPGKTYPMFGLHYWLQGVIHQVSNSQFMNLLFGDSSYIVNYLKFIGWKLNRVEQTGSNFGTNQRHDNPFLSEVGNGTIASDGIVMINGQMSASAFRLENTRIGDNNYLGNNIHFPSDARTGANCLLATKVMIPVDGPVRENVGLLGSPCFEIPRMVERDRDLNAALGAETRRERLRQKNVHNLVTAAMFLVSRWLFVAATFAMWGVALHYYDSFGVLALFAAGAGTTGTAILYFTLIERATLGFRRMKPQMVTIHDRYFWSHERHWKLSDSPIMQLFSGTPFKPMILRMAGAKVGRMVYDANCSITERSLTEIGDYCNLNEGSVLQAHSLEEGVFKSDVIRLGSGCTLGPAAFVHYGVTMGDHVVVDADSFLMKGEVLEAHSGWRGNPARMVRGTAAAQQPDSSVTRFVCPLPSGADEATVPRLAAE